LVVSSVALATEDELSEVVGQRLLAEAAHRLEAELLLRRSGSGYLRSGMDKWCALARTQPVVLLTDLDQQQCASTLVTGWMGKRNQPENFLLRVAVREVEAWLLADHDAVRSLFGGRLRLPDHPDLLLDPKRELLQFANRAARSVREDLVARAGSVATQGVAYNARLSEFVRVDWCPRRAQDRSDSLRRARRRIDELALRLHAQL
jgi:hypothetical protein